MYLPHAIALQALLTPGTLVHDNCIYHLFQHYQYIVELAVEEVRTVC